MTDNMTKADRSLTMSKIKSKGNTSTELRAISIFRKNGIKGWRRHQKIPGNPDFVFRKERIVIFVDGCFWHGCPRCYVAPKTNTDYWVNKIKKNRARDEIVNRVLDEKRWRVIRIWEHSLKEPENFLKTIFDSLNSGQTP